MRNFSKIIFMPLLLALSLVFASCSDDDGGGDSLVYEYGYKLNQTVSEKEYHRVVKYGCVDNGDNTFEVREYSIHYFATSNSSYKDLSGGQLCSLVKNGTRTSDDSKEYTLSSDKDSTMTNSSTGETKTFHLYSGLNYKVYWYY